MIYINKNWESVNDLRDVVRIINEYNHEFAVIIERLIPEHTGDEYADLKYDLDEALDEIEVLKDELFSKENEIDSLTETISDLEDRIVELEAKID